MAESLVKFEIFYGPDTIPLPQGTFHVTLSRRNLRALLAKLDGHPEHSKMTIAREFDAGTLVLTAEEDSVHYANRIPPGPMHPDTEAHG